MRMWHACTHEAAIECLPFENPKLSATTIATMDGKSFADRQGDSPFKRTGDAQP
jgi:hypothetical protein